MPLFTDGPISTIEDLSAQDSQLLTVASVEGIDVSRKIDIAQEQVAMDLLSALNRFGYSDRLFWLAPQPNLNMVVVTPSLKLWHTAKALELFYADAYNSQLNDRYAGKRDQFHDLATWAYGKLVEIGVGISGVPVPRATAPTLTPFPGALADGVYYVTITWVNGSGEEGAPTIPLTISTASSTFLVTPGDAARNGAGWNIYAGTALNTMYRQNSSLLEAGQTWEQPAALLEIGNTPGNGQKPNYLQPLPRIIQRG